MSQQQPLLAANWKMNPISAAAAAELVRAVIPVADAHPKVGVAVFPPFTWLLPVADLVEGSTVGLGAQDCFWEPAGAYTGEISAAMLAGWCTWVIVGHSERRQHFGETDEVVAKKVAAGLSAGLHVILCVGENAEQHEAAQTTQVVSAQVKAGLSLCSADDSKRLVLAYEPIWAIGTGLNAQPEHAYLTMRSIKKVVGEALGTGAARQVRILYGGSVNAGNVESYVELPLCDGCLVGGASLKPAEFNRMIEVTAEVYGAATHK